jgi:hypothetical protein
MLSTLLLESQPSEASAMQPRLPKDLSISNAVMVGVLDMYPRRPKREVTRANSTNVLDEGLRIGEIGRRMNSKVKSVKQGGYRK